LIHLSEEANKRLDKLIETSKRIVSDTETAVNAYSQNPSDMLSKELKRLELIEKEMITTLSELRMTKSRIDNEITVYDDKLQESSTKLDQVTSELSAAESLVNEAKAKHKRATTSLETLRSKVNDESAKLREYATETEKANSILNETTDALKKTRNEADKEAILQGVPLKGLMGGENEQEKEMDKEKEREKEQEKELDQEMEKDQLQKKEKEREKERNVDPICVTQITTTESENNVLKREAVSCLLSSSDSFPSEKWTTSSCNRIREAMRSLRSRGIRFSFSEEYKEYLREELGKLQVLGDESS
jgi:DNA repair exonuclease SbcCD ATPase subunit